MKSRLFEETPGRVAINEIIEICLKNILIKHLAKFINGVLSQFVTDEA